MFPVGAEGFDEDVLDGLVVLVTGVEFTAALSLAEKDPVGGAIAGAVKARSFAERFEQDGADLVALLPVAGELSLEAGEQMGGQAGQANPGLDTFTNPTLRVARSRCTTDSIRWPASG